MKQTKKQKRQVGLLMKEKVLNSTFFLDILLESFPQANKLVCPVNASCFT